MSFTPYGSPGFAAARDIANPARATGMTGMAALHDGRFHEARGIFEALIAAGAHDTSLFIALAMACRGANDHAAGLAAIDRALASEPVNVRALIVKADLTHDVKDFRGATAYYSAAITAAQGVQNLPPDLQEDLRRADRACQQQMHSFEAEIQAALARAGQERALEDSRMKEALDIMFGRAVPMFHAPRYFFYPGLSQTTFFDRKDFPFLDDVEAATDAIRAEALTVMREDNGFEPYVADYTNRPNHLPKGGMAGNRAWSAFFLWRDGKAITENQARCPVTTEVMARIPQCQMENRAPSIFFSVLEPGAHIPPHHGMVNTRLLGHLPLVVPGKCRFRVGNQVREWEEGKAWVFDDTFEHEAWNDSDKTRIILLFEVWRPEITEREKEAILTIFSAIDSHRGHVEAWDD